MANDNAQLLLAKSDRDSFFIYRNKNFFKSLSLFFLFFGVLVRLVQYINNRSLWDDEASIALNIVNRSYLELAFPLDHNQVAPPGFLWIEKFFIQLLGNNEYALRLFPLIAGIVSLLTFYLLANRYISALAVPIAIALLSCLPYNLYYATEVKQYGIDVMVSLLLCLILIPLREQILTQRQIFFLSFLGAICIWLSHPTIFTLSGLELSALVTTSAEKRSIFLNRLPIYLAWLLSFGLLYILTLSGSMQNATLQDSWGGGYPDFPFDVVWFFDCFGRFFYKPLGFRSVTDGIAIFAFICGCIAYYRRNKTLLFFLISPFLTTFIASYLKKYPFRDRLLLFLTPLAILIIAEGVAFLLNPSRSRILLKILSIFVVISLVVPPATSASHLVIRPQLKEEIKPVIEYVKSHQQIGESFYIYTRARSAFKYYAEKYGYFEGEYTLGDRVLPIDGKKTQQEEKFYQQEIEKLRGKRVWLLYRGDEEKQPEILSYLNPLGRQLDFFSQPGIFVYLYDMRSPLHDNNFNQ